MTKRRLLLQFAASLIFLVATSSRGWAQADDFAYDAVFQTVEVLIKATPPGASGGAELSRGWAISAPGQCFILSTAHGVTVTDGLGRYQGEMEEITITAPGRGSFAVTRRAELRERFTSDLAVLSLPEADCPFTGDLVFDRHRGFRRRAENGVDIEQRDAVGAFEKESLAIYRARLSPDDAIPSPEGWSGASVMEGGRRIGMVFEASGPRTFRFYSIRQIQRELDQIGIKAFVPSVEKQGFTVDAGGGAAYQSIQAAVDEAPDGTVITVRPGVYREQVIVTKDLQLIGETVGGERPHIVWTESTALAVSGKQIVVDNFEITGGLLWPSGNQGNAALEVTAGSPTMRNLIVRSSSFHCVRIINTEAAILEASQIGPCGAYGVNVNDGKAVLSNLDVFGFKPYGLIATRAGVMTVRNSTVRDGTGDGVFGIGYRHTSTGIVESTTIKDVSGAIQTGEQSTPIIRGSRGEDIDWTAIWTENESAPVVEDNEFFRIGTGRVYPAVFVQVTSNPTVRNNRFIAIRNSELVRASSAIKQQILADNDFERN